MLPARLILACLALATSLPAAADPPSWGMWQVFRERYHAPDSRDEDYRVVYATQPRVAAAEMVPVARGLPFGFNRGTCDRELVAPAGPDGALGLGLDGTDRACVLGALEHLPDARQIAWTGEAGEIFRVSPERSYQVSGLLCRDYAASVQLGGRRQQTFGTACRLPDGQWEIVD